MKLSIILFLIVSLISCNLSDEKIDLGDNCALYDEGEHDKIIACSSNWFIPCEVTHYGFTSEFIIAVQKPTKECFLGKDTLIYSEGKDEVYYWLVIPKVNLKFGPMNKSDFEKARIIYRVPKDLELISTD